MRTLALGALLLLITACGSSTKDDSPKGGVDTSGTPACAAAWVTGKILPKDYEGCMNDGTLEAAISYDCKDGSELFGYNDQFWALGGQEIHAGVDTTAYSTAYDTCKGL